MSTSDTVSRQQHSEQARAHTAWECVESVEKNKSIEKEKYGSLARQLPALIQTNGLGQTLAFLRAKGKNKDNHHNLIYDHISKWVMQQLQAQGSDSLLEWIIQQNSNIYRQATTESLAFAIWLRRFAEAKGWGEQGMERSE